MSDFRLKVFQSVAKHLSFTRASQEMFVSQPAITKHIKELESFYHTRLFERQGNRISLTESGNLLLKHSERILNEYKRLEFDMNLLQGNYTGSLKLGASTTVEQYVLPEVLGDFIKKFPQINVSLLNGNSRFIESALQEHKIDIGIVEGIIRLPHLRYTPFTEDELVGIVNGHTKLETISEEISIEQLKRTPLVLREQGSGTLDVIENCLAEQNVKLSQLNILMYLGSTECIKRFTENNDCMGIVSVRSVEKELADGSLRIVDVPQLEMKRNFSFVECQGEDNGLAKLFMQYAINHERRM